MSLISYAQNFEDVMLWRALKHVTPGFYIDIGAQHPVIDSVSKAFHDQGWRGVHVEATASYAALLRQDRPDEIVVEAAVSDSHGIITFYEIPDTGISTGDPDIAKGHEARGFAIRAANVPTVTLDDIFKLAGSREIHWLKIDVEGMERQVLTSWAGNKARPWIVVVESTLPLSQVESHSHWEGSLLDRGYAPVYFDGLNRFYVSAEHGELLGAFASGPNVFDDFVLNGTASAPFCTRVHADHLRQKHEVEVQLAESRQAQLRSQQEFDAAIAGLSGQVNDFQARIQLVQDETIRVQQACAERERESADRAAELLQQAYEESRASAAALLQREQQYSEQLDAVRAQMLNVQQESAQRERVLQEHAADELRQARAEIQERMDALVRQERVFSEQMSELRAQMQANDAGAVERERALREQAAAELRAVRDEAQSQLLLLMQREHALVEQIEAVRVRADDMAAQQLRIHAEQLAELRQRLADEVARERAVAEQISASLREARLHLEQTHASWSWRLSAPLRALAGFLHAPARGRPDDTVGALNSVPVNAELAAMPVPVFPQPPNLSEYAMPNPTPEIRALPEAAAKSLEELLALHDEAFVQCAYRTLLGRPADPAGLAYYLRRIRAGHAKQHLLAQIFVSHECRQRIRTNERLAKGTRSVRWLGWPVIGGLVRSIGRWLDHSEGKNRARAIENQVHALEWRQSARLDRIEGLFSNLGLADTQHRLSVIEQQAGQNIAELRQLTARTESMATELQRISEGSLEFKNRLLAVEYHLNPLSEEIRKLGRGRIDHHTAPRAGAEPATTAVLPERVERQRLLSPHDGTLYYYVDHTIGCPVNTGMQRVTRQLARALLEQGRRVIFVKWNVALNRLVLVNRAELEHLAQWGGPSLTSGEISEAGYPHANDAEPRQIPPGELHDRGWLVVPEVTHINAHGRQLTLDIVLAARRAGLRTAFVFYDAIPLRRAELATMAPLHEAYMRQLLQADAILPISAWSAQELHGFLRHHELASDDDLPFISPLLLPAEVRGQSRVTAPHGARSSATRKILCVGSIDVRKNQIALVRAFVALARASEIGNWHLGLIGNCNGDLIAELGALMAECPAVIWHGNATDAALREAYAECEFTVFPSIEEGFGLPIAESLWYGKPSLCANFGPMAEVAVGGGCLQVDMRNEAAIINGLRSLMTDDALRAKLATQAMQRDLGTWADYGRDFSHRLEARSNPINNLRVAYYLVDHTATYQGNSGIQRVVRALASALQRQGVRLIAAKWNADMSALVPPTADELVHLSKWNGPPVDGWEPWREPVGLCAADWVIFPELTSHYQPAQYARIRSFLDARAMRGCWVFYDTIPWKLRDIYPEAATQGHRYYMAGLNLFELILPISRYSREQLEMFYLGEPQATTDLTHRLVACPLPGEFLETRRVLQTKPAHTRPVHVLSVGTLEPRKNHLKLVQAFLRASANSTREMRLTLAGGAHAEIAEQIAPLLANNPNIQWIKHPSDAELNQLYADCDFTVYPSYEEGFGLPILESLWHARPCICMNRGAMAEVAEGGGCVLVDTTVEQELADAIHRLANDDALRGKLARETVRRPFRTWDDYANDVALRMAEERCLPAGLVRPAPLQSAASAAEVYASMPNIARRPILSVCISTYNRAKWLTLSLAVLVREAQGLGGRVEVLVCDNTSTDNTPEIVAPYVADGTVRYHRNAVNVGMLGNLRVTAQEARGEYIWILGDDDLLNPGAIRRVLEVIETNADLAMVYVNYAFTREDSPDKISDMREFLASATPVADGGQSGRALVKEVAVRNENFFTAIYCVAFQRSHALLAYSQFTEGEPFSSLPTCVPTTNHVLHHMMNLPAYWLAEPQIVINMNVSWLRYAWRWILERFPEIHDVAVRYGADPRRVDTWRDNYMTSTEHYLNEVFHSADHATVKDFNFVELVVRMKHTERYHIHKARFVEIYNKAVVDGHPRASRSVESVFLQN